jgi:hypothetical protein
VDTRIDGVLLHVEWVADGDEDLVTVLREHAVLGRRPCCVAVPPGLNRRTQVFLTAVHQASTVWSKEYKQSVAILADRWW